MTVTNTIDTTAVEVGRESVAHPIDFGLRADEGFHGDTGNLVLEIACDTEYLSQLARPLIPITVQLQSMAGGSPRIYEHPAYQDSLLKRGGHLPTFQGSIWETLVPDRITRGYWDLDGMSLKGIPQLRVKTTMYYAAPDIYLQLANPDYWPWLCRHMTTERGKLDFQKVKSGKGGKLLTAVTPWLKIPYFVFVDGDLYQVALGVQDLVKKGPPGKGFAGLMSSLGIDTCDKGLLDKYKDKMDKAYEDAELRKVFIRYSLGDVRHFPEIVEKLFQGQEDLRNITVPDSKPFKKLHAGNGTLNCAIVEKLVQYDFRGCEPWLQYEIKDGRKHRVATPHDIVQTGSFKQIVKERNSNELRLALTAGGMARNMRPDECLLKGIIVDNDGKGFYVGIMNSTPFCVGIPTLWGASEQVNRKVKTLDDFLKETEGELVDRAWYIVGSTLEELSFDQSLILSKVARGGFSLAQIAAYLDTKIQNGGVVDDLEADVMMLTREIVNGVINSDLLAMLRKAMSRKEFKEFSTKFEVTASAYYARSNMSTPEEMEQAYALAFAEGRMALVKETTANHGSVTVDDRPREWYPLPLKRVVGVMAAERSKAKKERDKKSKGSAEWLALEGRQLLFKLTGNSVFGAMSSSILDFTSAVTAHNITGAGRAWVWGHAMSMNAVMCVTDGAALQLTDVRFPGSRGFTMQGLTTGLRKEHPDNGGRNLNKVMKRCTLAGLDWTLEPTEFEKLDDEGNPEIIKGAWLRGYNGSGMAFEELGYEEHWPKLSGLLESHMKSFWGTGVPVIDSTAHAVKDVFTEIAWYGQTNYRLKTTHGKHKIKARGHKPGKMIHSYTRNQTSGVKDGDFDSDVTVMFDAIANGQPVPHFAPQYRSQMLKPNVYNLMAQSSRSNDVKEFGLLPGAQYHHRTHLRPLTLSLFQFRTWEQREAWFEIHERLKSSEGYGLELMFLVPGGVDYLRMVQTLQQRIDEGWMAPNQPKKARGRNSLATQFKDCRKHPYFELNPLCCGLPSDSDDDSEGG